MKLFNSLSNESVITPKNISVVLSSAFGGPVCNVLPGNYTQKFVVALTDNPTTQDYLNVAFSWGFVPKKFEVKEC